MAQNTQQNQKKSSQEGDSQVKLAQDVSGLNRRLRIIEERYSNLRNKNQLTEQNMLRTRQELERRIGVDSEEIKNLRKEISEIKNKMSIVVKELQMLAKKEDVDVLKRYIEIWEPVEFVTANQVKKIVQEVLNEKR